jgi:spore germination cell wall hydrolase CwlJ-like protein
MLGSFRPRILAVLILGLAGLFATPALAAEQLAPAVETASVSNLPSLATIVREQTAQTVADQAAAARQAAQQAAAQALPATAGARPLKDLVLSFVDFGNQDEEQLCLAKAVYFEARSESLEGQLAVAEVVLNRARSGVYPPSICGVVTQHAQFSFIRAGRFPAPNTASDAWHRALAIAEIAGKHLATEVASNVLWYHADYVAPAWGRQRTRVAQIGAHIFYS